MRPSRFGWTGKLQESWSDCSVGDTCRKSAGVTITTPLNRFNASRSSSPVTIQSALPLIASSRILSSLGSRQIRVESTISTTSDASKSAAKNSARSSLDTYLSNRGRLITSAISSDKEVDIRTISFCKAQSSAFPGTERSNNNALMMTLMSKMLRITLHPK